MERVGKCWYRDSRSRPQALYAGRSALQIVATGSCCRSAAARTKTTTASNA